MSIKILADSASDLPNEIYEKYNIDVMPLSVIMDKQEYSDRIDLDSKKLFNYMESGGVPKTSQVAYTVIKQKFNELASYYDTIIYIAFSSGLSGTYTTAKLVEMQMKEINPDLDLIVIDSKCATIGLGLLVMDAAKMVQNGSTKYEVINRINFNINHMEHIFTVKNLEYLYKGGRIKKSEAYLGNMLNINPILCVKDGKLVALKKVRGRKKTIRNIVKILESRGDKLQHQIIGITHGNDLEEVEYLKNVLEKEYKISEIIINDVGSVIGAHTGPGFLGVCFLNKLNYKLERCI